MMNRPIVKMTSNINRFVLAVAFVCAGFSGFTRASVTPLGSMRSMDWNQLQNDFVFDNQQFRGDYSDQHQWKGRLCTNRYSYKVRVQGKTDKVDFNLNEDATVDIQADLSALYFRANGAYRSDYTLCGTVRGWTGIGIDWAQLKGKAEFTEGGKPDLSDLSIRITETKFGTIHVGTWVPHWFENFLTSLVNRAAERVWASKAGAWLSKRIADEIKKHIPPPGP